MKIALLYPPDASVPVAPFGSLPLLAACLRRAGHEVLVLDLAALTLRWALRAESVERFYGYARTQRDPRLRRGLARLLAIPEELVRGAERAARELRDPDVYFDPARLRASWRSVRAAIRLFSALRPDIGPRNRDFARDLFAHLEGARDDVWVEALDSEALARLRAFGPELFAVSVPFSPQLVATMEVARWLRRRFPGVPLVAGGTALSDSEHALIGDARFYEHVDFACVGDGEEALVELAAAVGGSGGDLDGVPALYRRSPDGAVVPPRTRRLASLDSSPTPDFTGIDFELYLAPEKIALMSTSRGCYYGECTFCNETFQKRFRRRSSPVVWEDVRHIARVQGITNFMFWDPLTPPGMLREISERAAAERLDINWAAEVKFEELYTDRAYVETLARGGCHYLQFGFESAVQRVLDDMRKGNDLAQVGVILERLREARIAVGVFWFIGFPTELEDDARETWRYLSRNRGRIALSGYVGTFGIGEDVPVARMPERYGIEITTSASGEPSFRRLDGRDWDPERLHQTFQARNDLHLVQSGAALLYSRRRPERLDALTAQAHVAPPTFLSPPLAELELSLAPGNGYTLARAGDADGEGSYAFVAGSSLLHDLAPQDAELVRALQRGTRAAELVARGDADTLERLERFLDYGILDARPRSAARAPALVP